MHICRMVARARLRCKLLLAELLSSLEAAEGDLGDLEEVLRVVESNRQRFPNLDDAELDSRRTFVRSSRRITLSIRDDLSTHAPKCARAATSGRGGGGSEREGLLSGASSPAPAVAAGAQARGGGCGGCGCGHATHELTPSCDPHASARAANAACLDGHAQLQQAQMEMQEETLDELHGAVGRLKELGHTMNDELSVQRRMMDELGSQVENASGAMASLKARMQLMAKSKDRGKFCAILLLSALLFMLVCLVLYT